MKSIILLAAPAAGKGTQAQILTERLDIPHISTGDLLRESLSSGSKIGNELKEIMESGKLVSDDLVIDLLKTRITKGDCSNGYILDGFPRNINQAIAYDKMLMETSKEIGYVFLLDVDYDTAMKRSLGRLSCPNCKAVYNDMILESNPMVDNICDICGSSLEKRIDDNEETFKNRYQTYQKETKPLINYYEEKKLLCHIDSGKKKEYTTNEIIKVLNLRK